MFRLRVYVCLSEFEKVLRMCASWKKARRAAAPSDWWPARPQPLMKNARGSHWELISRSSSPCHCPPCRA